MHVALTRESIYAFRPCTGEHLRISPLHGRASTHVALTRESIYAFRPYTGEHLRILALRGIHPEMVGSPEIGSPEI